MDGPTVSLIVVNYNTAGLTTGLVAAAGPGADEVIVVDNASPEGPPDLPPGTVLVTSPANRGYGAGANLGAARATGEVLIVTNPDVSLAPADVRVLASAAVAPGVALVAPRFVTPGGALIRSAHRRDPGLLVTLQELCTPFAAVMARIDPEWHATLLRSAEHGSARDVRHVLGAVMAIRASAFRAVGGFDERYFLYREETDLCVRLRRAGWRIRHEPAATAVHIGDASSRDPLPVAARDAALESHYRFIRLHGGRARAAVNRAVGTVASATWALAGPDRRAGRHALAWHAGVRR